MDKAEWLMRQRALTLGKKVVARQVAGTVDKTLSALREQAEREIAEARASGSLPLLLRTLRENYTLVSQQGQTDTTITIDSLKRAKFRRPGSSES